MHKSLLEKKYLDLFHMSSLKNDTLHYNDNALFEVMEELAGDCSLVSLATIKKVLLNLLRNDLENVKISKRIFDLPKELTKNKSKFTAYVLLHGIKLKVSKIDLGRYTVHRYDSGPLRGNKERSLTQAVKDAGCYIEVRDIESAIPTLPIGDIDVIQHDFVIEEASRLAQDVEHILNLYIASLTSQSRSYCRITTSLPASQSQITAYRDQSSSQQLLSGVNYKSIHFMPYEIDQDAIDNWLNLDLVIKIFNEENPEDIRGRIKKSITWYSKWSTPSLME